jgi:hypothetical protein
VTCQSALIGPSGATWVASQWPGTDIDMADLERGELRLVALQRAGLIRRHPSCEDFLYIQLQGRAERAPRGGWPSDLGFRRH